MSETWIAIIGGLIATFVSGFTSWFFTKKKYNAEVDNNLISNMQQSLDFYKSLADDNKERLDLVLAENATLRVRVDELSREVKRLTDALSVYGIQKLADERK